MSKKTRPGLSVSYGDTKAEHTNVSSDPPHPLQPRLAQLAAEYTNSRGRGFPRPVQADDFNTHSRGKSKFLNYVLKSYKSVPDDDGMITQFSTLYDLALHRQCA